MATITTSGLTGTTGAPQAQIQPATQPQAPTIPPVVAPQTATTPASPGPASGTAPIVEPVPVERPITSPAPEVASDKINSVMLWYALSAFVYAKAFHKTAEAIRTSTTGNGLFPSSPFMGKVPPPITEAEIVGEKEKASAATGFNKHSMRSILDEMPKEKADEVLVRLDLDKNLNVDV